MGISPKMFHESCFPYYRDVCKPMGLLYYGCCDQAFMGEALRGTDIVFSRKPDPNHLSVDVKLDEGAWAAHIRETLEATHDVFVEFIIRDVYTVHGSLDNPRRAVEVARREIERLG